MRSSAAPLEGRGKLPRQVHGVTDTGIHALAADRAVNVRRITEEERASAAEPVGDSMVHAIGREPVHAVDVDPHPLEHTPADIVPGQVLAPVRGLPRRPAPCRRAEPGPHLQRKDCEEIRAVERDVDVAIHHRSARLDIGDVEQVLVGSAVRSRSTTSRGRASGRRHSRQGTRPRRCPASVCAPQAGDDAIAVLLEPEELRLPLDRKLRRRAADRSAAARARPAER